MPPKIKALLFAFAAVVSSEWPAAGEEPVDPGDGWAILQSALRESDVSYQGLLTLTRWSGSETQSEEAHVYFRPPQHYRLEFLSPDGEVERVVVSDGDEERIAYVGRKKIMCGKGVHRPGKLMPPEAEWGLLSRNYVLSGPREEEISGRRVWQVTLKAKRPGKPQQKLCIDQKTRVILEVRRYLPQGQSASAIRFVKFEPGVDLGEDLFKIAASSGEVVREHGWGPRYMSLEDLSRAVERQAVFPPEMPEGFFFESGDIFRVRGHKVVHVRYTDGLAVVSVFLTDDPVQMPRSVSQSFQNLTERSGSVRLPRIMTRVSHGRSGQAYLTVIGDTSQGLLDDMRAALR